jgi:hypothetical protein
MPVCTTLNRISKRVIIDDGLEKLLRSLNKTKSDDEPLSLVDILDSNGLDDAIWCLPAVEGHDKEIRLFAVACAREVQHLLKDPRSVEALDVSERFAHGNATVEELENAHAAARAAAHATARAAAPVADVAWQAYYAAYDAAVYAAAHAASAAARDADPAQAFEQAYDQAIKKQAEIFRRIFG